MPERPYRYPRATTASIGAIVAVLSAADAQEVSDDLTTPVETATANDGAPGDIVITENGSITLDMTDGLSAVRINSDNTVVNDGSLELNDAISGTGVFIEAGRTGLYRGGGAIRLVEDYSREDDDEDGDADGPFALGSNRFGLRVGAGEPFIGDLEFQSGSAITVEGNDSAAILAETRISGSVTLDGTVSVLGDRSVGIDLREGLDGDLRLAAPMAIRGADASALRVQGSVGGALTIESEVSGTGFASVGVTNFIAEENVDEDTLPVEERIDAEDLNPNGPVVAIGGSVAQGVLVNGPVDDFISQDDLDDEVKDTFDDFDENRAVGQIIGTGPGAVLRISPSLSNASAGDLTIGLVRETIRDTLDDNEDGDSTDTLATFDLEFGLINRGTLRGEGLNVGFAATVVQIDGADGFTTTIEGGILNRGSMIARAFEADARALSLGFGASVPRLRNEGVLTSQILGADAGDAAIVLDVASGAAIAELVNTGTITAAVDDPEADAIAIRDLSGTLSLIENRGAIRAQNTNDEDSAEPADRFVAIDLSAHGADAPVTLTQRRDDPTDDVNRDEVVDEEDVPDPIIAGSIRLGAGADAVDLLAGEVEGQVDLGPGDDVFRLENASLTGDLILGAGADRIDLAAGAVLDGRLLDEDGSAIVTLVDAELVLRNTDPLTINTLDVQGASRLSINIDATDTTDARIRVNGDATLSPETELVVTLEDFQIAPQSVTIIEAQTLSLGATAGALVVDPPAVFAQTTQVGDGRVTVSLAPRSAQDLGLNATEGALYDVLLPLAERQVAIGDALVGFEEDDELLSGIAALAPDYTGAKTRFLADSLSLAGGPMMARFEQIHGFRDEPRPTRRLNLWALQNWSYRVADSGTTSQGYEALGLTLQGGVDVRLATDLFVGAGAAFRFANIELDRTDLQVQTPAGDISLYATYAPGAFQFDGVATVGRAFFSSDRSVAFGDLQANYEGDWNGDYFGVSGRASYTAEFGDFYLKPSAAFDYFDLTEDAYAETIGSPIEDGELPLRFSVGDAESTRTAAAGTLAFGRRAGRFGARDDAQAAVRREVSRARYTVQQGYVGVRYGVEETPYRAAVSFAGEPGTFNVETLDEYDGSLVFGLSAKVVAGGFVFQVNYDGELGDDFFASGLGASFRITF